MYGTKNNETQELTFKNFKHYSLMGEFLAHQLLRVEKTKHIWRHVKSQENISTR